MKYEDPIYQIDGELLMVAIPGKQKLGWISTKVILYIFASRTHVCLMVGYPGQRPESATMLHPMRVQAYKGSVLVIDTASFYGSEGVSYSGEDSYEFTDLLCSGSPLTIKLTRHDIATGAHHLYTYNFNSSLFDNYYSRL